MARIRKRKSYKKLDYIYFDEDQIQEPNVAESEDVAELESLSNFGDDSADVDDSSDVGRRCTHCFSAKTPQWRLGPLGPKTLCNACGLRYITGRLVPEYRPAASPTFVPTLHSNSHKEVLKLHRQEVLTQDSNVHRKVLKLRHQEDQQTMQTEVVPPSPADASQKQVHQIYGFRHSQESHPLPSSSRYPTESNNTKVTEANMQSYTLLDLPEKISSLPLEKDCELNKEASLSLANREASPSITDSVQKLNKNVSDSEEVDSATQTDLVTVAGYKVKGEIAPFLRKIFSEHGDIASECILQAPETRAALLESVCMIYRELEPKLPNITSLEVNSMQARIKDLETVRLRVEWLYKRLEEVSNVKGLLDKSRSLEEARAKCTESIEREERDLEALESELSILQQKISSKKADLALLKTEAETIEAAFQTMAKMGAFPEQSTVTMTRRTGGKKWSMPISKVLKRTDVQQPQRHSPIRRQTDNSYWYNPNKFITDSCQQLRESGHPQLNHDTVVYLKDQSCNPQSDSQTYNLQCNSSQPYSQPQSMSQNLQQRSSQSNLHAHSNRLSKPQHSAQFNSENEHYRNYDASFDDVIDLNTPAVDYTPSNDRGTQNQEDELKNYKELQNLFGLGHWTEDDVAAQ